MVDTLCANIALGGPLAVATTKRLLRAALDSRLEGRATRFAAARELSDALFASPEGREGMAAFAEKRRPAWQHIHHP
jgi:methylglutaconyl-CoA hydratase